jgi:ferredoxin
MMPEREAEQSFQVILETPEGTRHLLCGRDEYLWDAAARQGVWLPSICLQGRCLTCAGKLVQGEVNQSSADSFFTEDEEAGFVLLCRARPRSNLQIRTHQAGEMRAHRLAHGLPAPYA